MTSKKEEFCKVQKGLTIKVRLINLIILKNICSSKDAMK